MQKRSSERRVRNEKGAQVIHPRISDYREETGKGEKRKEKEKKKNGTSFRSSSVMDIVSTNIISHRSVITWGDQTLTVRLLAHVGFCA